MGKTRKVEVFSAGCPLCDEAEKRVRKLACPSCDITVLKIQEPLSLQRAKELGVKSVPAIAVNGKLIGCCAGQSIDEKTLLDAGIGSPITS
jgi:glutaredoxin